MIYTHKKCPVCNSNNIGLEEERFKNVTPLGECFTCGSNWNCEGEITLDVRNYFTDKENKQLGMRSK